MNDVVRDLDFGCKIVRMIMHPYFELSRIVLDFDKDLWIDPECYKFITNLFNKTKFQIMDYQIMNFQSDNLKQYFEKKYFEHKISLFEINGFYKIESRIRRRIK